MILTNKETGEEFEFDTSKAGWSHRMGYLKPIEKEAKEWPQENDAYWYVSHSGLATMETMQEFTKALITGIYRTKEEAQHAADRIRSLKDAIVDEIEDTPLLDHYKRVCLYIDKKYLKAWKYLESEEK